MSVHWDKQASFKAMESRPKHERDAIYDAISNGQRVAYHKSVLHPPGSSKRTKVRRKA